MIAITLDRVPSVYRGGDTLRMEYQFDALEAEEIQAVEASVLWYTEGKGEPDMGVLYFRRMTPDDVDGRDLRPMQRVDVPLPPSPLTYDGVILKIRWCVRVRLFLSRGREYLEELGFQLGEIPPAAPLGSPLPPADAPSGGVAPEEADE
ncbi:MAG: hypothetical protein KDA41_19400 [Planctomycetales bacterium]|nr:hypothetical protein [Planctomycetales bacterium]